jgi:hypothetical protein
LNFDELLGIDSFAGGGLNVFQLLVLISPQDVPFCGEVVRFPSPLFLCY